MAVGAAGSAPDPPKDSCSTYHFPDFTTRASPMVGGMVSATVLTLVVIPAVYVLWRRGQIEKRP